MFVQYHIRTHSLHIRVTGRRTTVISENNTKKLLPSNYIHEKQIICVVDTGLYTDDIRVQLLQNALHE